MGKNISKNLSSKYSQKRFDHGKQSATDALKTTSKRAVIKTPERTGDLTGKRITDKITKVSRNLPQNSSETIQSETKKQDLIEKYQKKDT